MSPQIYAFCGAACVALAFGLGMVIGADDAFRSIEKACDNTGWAETKSGVFYTCHRVSWEQRL